MAEHTVVLIPGFGAGPQLVNAATRVIDAAGAGQLDMTYQLCDERWDQDVAAVPSYVPDVCRKHPVVLAGPLGKRGGADLDGALLRELGLFALASPLLRKAESDVPAPLLVCAGPVDGMGAVDLAKGSRAAQKTARLVGDEGAGHVPASAALALEPTTKDGCEQLLAWAFARAQQRGAGRVAVIAEPSLTRTGGALMAEAAAKLAAEAGDAVTLALVGAQEGFALLAAGMPGADLLVAPGRYAAAALGVAAGLAEGVGAAPLVACGSDLVLFSAAGVRADDENPTPLGMLRAAVLLLRHVGEKPAAERLEQALQQTLQAAAGKAPDGPEALVSAVLSALHA